MRQQKWATKYVCLNYKSNSKYSERGVIIHYLFLIHLEEKGKSVYCNLHEDIYSNQNAKYCKKERKHFWMQFWKIQSKLIERLTDSIVKSSLR